MGRVTLNQDTEDIFKKGSYTEAKHILLRGYLTSSRYYNIEINPESFISPNRRKLKRLYYRILLYRMKGYNYKFIGRKLGIDASTIRGHEMRFHLCAQRYFSRHSVREFYDW